MTLQRHTNSHVVGKYYLCINILAEVAELNLNLELHTKPVHNLTMDYGVSAWT
jgi:hypothetical protein